MCKTGVIVEGRRRFRDLVIIVIIQGIDCASLLKRVIIRFGIANHVSKLVVRDTLNARNVPNFVPCWAVSAAPLQLYP